MTVVQSMRRRIVFCVAVLVIAVESIHPVPFVQTILSTSIATSERFEILRRAVLDSPTVVDDIRKPWSESSFDTTLVNSTSTDLGAESETYSELSYDGNMDSIEEVSRQLRLTTRFLCFLSMISGFGEICSMKSYGCFVNMVTGSTVRILVAFLEGRFDSVRVQYCAVLGYFLGICLSQTFQQKPSNRISNSRHESTSVSIRPVVALVLSFFSIPEFLMMFNRLCQMCPPAGLTAFSAMAQAAGYGLIAQTLLDSFSVSVNVYVITGHYVAIAKSVVNNVLLNRSKTSWSFVVNLRQDRAVQILLSFLFGVILAVCMYQFCTFLLPFQHSLTGFFYAATFVWFSIHHQPSVISLYR